MVIITIIIFATTDGTLSGWKRLYKCTELIDRSMS